MEIIKNNFFVLTGGPGGGKTTLLDALGANGFRCVPETARIIIKERLDKGLSPRPDPATFAVQMFQKDLTNYLENLDRSEIVFFDRSYLDSAFMVKETSEWMKEEIKKVSRSHRFYPKVFITPPWKEIYRNDAERDQTFEESIQVYSILSGWYESNGYELMHLAKASVEERVALILSVVKGL